MNVYLNAESRVPAYIFPDPDRVKAPKHWKDPAKILSYQVEHARPAFDALQVKASVAQVFVISYQAEGDEAPTVLMHNDEASLFRAFEERVLELRERSKEPIVWVTFNGCGFDFPFLRTRAVRHGCYVVAREMNCRKWGDFHHVDVFLTLGQEDTLDEWCAFFGVELDNPISGREMTDAVEKQKHDLVLRHTISRIVGVREIYAKLKAAGVV